MTGAHLRAYDRAIEWAQMRIPTSESVCWLLQRQQKTPRERGFVEADEGTRTLDLLHGKETARVDWSRQEGRKRPRYALFVGVE